MIKWSQRHTRTQVMYCWMKPMHVHRQITEAAAMGQPLPDTHSPTDSGNLPSLIFSPQQRGRCTQLGEGWGKSLTQPTYNAHYECTCYSYIVMPLGPPPRTVLNLIWKHMHCKHIIPKTICTFTQTSCTKRIWRKLQLWITAVVETVHVLHCL